MIGKTMELALNKQLNAELYSAYLYLSMSGDFISKGLKGVGNWFHVQAQEEMVHAMKFYTFILDRGGHVTLTAIDGPQAEWPSVLAAFQAGYAHEQKVTGLIHKLVDLALKQSDHPTNTFLQWFVTEQVEEEANASEVVQQLTLMGDAPGGLFMMDRQLATRVFVPPPVAGEPAP